MRSKQRRHRTSIRKMLIESLEKRTLLTAQIDFMGFQYDSGAPPHKILAIFNENVQGLSAGDLHTENVSTSDVVTTTLDYSNSVGTFSITGHPNGILPKGNYQSTIFADAVLGTDGLPMSADGNFEFFFLPADANHDRTVNLTDQNILAANYGQSPRTFSQGDFNYDGIVNLADFDILAAHFGATLAPMPAPNSLSVSDGVGQNELIWDLGDIPADAEGIRIQRSTDGQTFGVYHTLMGLDHRSYIDDGFGLGLPPGTRFWYRVRAFGGADGGTSYTAKQDGITVMPAPENVTAEAISASQIVLTWDDVTSNEVKYKIEVTQVGGGTWVIDNVPANSTGTGTYTVENLNPNTNYTFRLLAVGPARESIWTLPTEALSTAIQGPEVVDLPASMKTSLYTFIGDHSVSNSERWSMKVGDMWHSSPDYGVVQRDLREFKRGDSYQIEVRHDGTNRPEGPDYDYRAWIDRLGNPAWTDGQQVASGPNYFVVDNNNPRLVQKRWFGDDENVAAGKTATLVIPGIDLDVDTANDDGYGTVFDNAAEDRDEELNTKGKWILANTGDIDEDDILDFADLGGIAGTKFTPVFLRLPASLSLSGATTANVSMTFTYSFSDPTGVTTTPAPNHFRLWTVDASSARGEAQLLRSGEQLTAADIGLTFGGTKTLYLEAVRGSTINRPLTVSASVAGTVWSGSVQDQVYVSAAGFSLKTVNFDSAGPFFVVTGDDGTVYSVDPWRDNDIDGTPDREWPVAFRRGTTMRAHRQFVFTAPSSFLFGPNLAVRGEGPYSYDFLAYYGPTPNDPQAYFEKVGNTVTFGDSAAQPFPDYIDHFDPMKLNWSFSIDGGSTFVGVGRSKNQVYTLLEVPVQTADPLYHTVVHLATRLSKGMVNPAAVTTAIWGEFSDQHVDTATAIGTPASKLLTYYNNYLTQNFETAQLLSSGDGQCGAWVRLFIDTLRANGIDNADYMQIRPNDLNGNGDPNDEWLLVNAWTFAGAGTSPDPAYPYANYFNPATGYIGATGYNWYSASEVTDGPGAPGQGNMDPASLFNNHQLVRISGTYYDPSAGISYPSLAAFESNPLTGLAGYAYFAGFHNEAAIGRDVNGDGDMLDTAGVFHLKTNPVGNQVREDPVDY